MSSIVHFHQKKVKVAVVLLYPKDNQLQNDLVLIYGEMLRKLRQNFFIFDTFVWNTLTNVLHFFYFHFGVDNSNLALSKTRKKGNSTHFIVLISCFKPDNCYLTFCLFMVFGFNTSQQEKQMQGSFLDLINNDLVLFFVVFIVSTFFIHLLLHFCVGFLFAARNAVLSSTSRC